MNNDLDIQQAIINLRSSISETSQLFFYDDTSSEDVAWNVENCFLKLIALTQAVDLLEISKMVSHEYNVIKNSQRGFSEIGTDPYGDSYSIPLFRIKQFFLTIEMFLSENHRTKTTKDLISIIRDIHYVIADKTQFRSVPQNENDVHLRVELILKPTYPDLQHKPKLAKSIKNFEPDTGIPSLNTLIEYKFLSKKEDVPIVADQILADTRGYSSKEWRKFIYVIYETGRCKSEREWNNLLRESDVPQNTTIIVLSGVPKQ